MLVITAGCSEAPRAESEQFAFVAPDNQTGDASFEWAAGVIHHGLAAAVGASVGSDTIADARAAAGIVNRFVYSTLSKAETPGELRLHSAVFDPSGDRLIREFTVTGNALEVINRMAGNLTAEPHPLGVKSEEDLRKWPIFKGDVDDYQTRCLDLAEAHPEFAAAAAACLNQLTTLRRLDAVRDLMNLIPAATIAEFSPEVQFAFGQGYMAVKEYSKATGMFKLIGRRPAAMNLLGYAEALSGNCDAAKTALEEYASAPGEEANGFDSLGETSYFCGRFKAAEQYFEQSAGKWKNERDQIEPVKAAAMRLLSGDAKGAEQIAATHFRKIGKGDPRAVAALEPVWKAIAGAATDQERRAKIEATLIHRP